MENRKQVVLSYVGIVAVIFIWGMSPLIKKTLIGSDVSAALYVAVTNLFAGLAMLALSAKQLRQLNRSYFKLAVPLGLCVGAAGLLQALAYNFNASPTNQAFLENLSCLTVPLLLFLVARRRPNVMTLLACVLCLLSSMVLAGVFHVGLRFHAADVLNALAGLLYGVNIAITGLHSKKFVPQLYVMLQLFTQVAFYSVMAVAFHFIKVGGAPIDPLVFHPSVPLVAVLIGWGILTSAVCWTVRTAAMRFVSPTVVAVLMPFSAVITAVVSILLGKDALTPSVLIGAALGLAAGLLSGFGDLRTKSKKKADP